MTPVKPEGTFRFKPDNVTPPEIGIPEIPLTETKVTGVVAVPLIVK